MKYLLFLLFAFYFNDYVEQGTANAPVQNVVFTDLDERPRQFKGYLTITVPVNETAITEYFVYYYPSTEMAMSISKIGGDFAVYLSDSYRNLEHPYIAVVANYAGLHSTPFILALIDFKAPDQGIVHAEFIDTDSCPFLISGTVTIHQPFSRNNIDSYKVYLTDDSNEILLFFDSVNKSDVTNTLTVTIPANTPNQGLHKIAIFSENAVGSNPDYFTIEMKEFQTPNNPALSFDVQDINPNKNVLSCTILLDPSYDESDIDYYRVFLNDSSSNRFDISNISPKGSQIQIDIDSMHFDDDSSICITTLNSVGEHVVPTCRIINDFINAGNNCEEPAIAYSGDIVTIYIFTIPTSTIQCREKCQENAACNFYSYDTDSTVGDNGCMMYSAINYRYAKATRTSAKKLCPMKVELLEFVDTNAGTNQLDGTLTINFNLSSVLPSELFIEFYNAAASLVYSEHVTPISSNPFSYILPANTIGSARYVKIYENESTGADPATTSILYIEDRAGINPVTGITCDDWDNRLLLVRGHVTLSFDTNTEPYMVSVYYGTDATTEKLHICTQIGAGATMQCALTQDISSGIYSHIIAVHWRYNDSVVEKYAIPICDNHSADQVPCAVEFTDTDANYGLYGGIITFSAVADETLIDSYILVIIDSLQDYRFTYTTINKDGSSEYYVVIPSGTYFGHSSFLHVYTEKNSLISKFYTSIILNDATNATGFSNGSLANIIQPVATGYDENRRPGTITTFQTINQLDIFQNQNGWMVVYEDYLGLYNIKLLYCSHVHQFQRDLDIACIRTIGAVDTRLRHAPITNGYVPVVVSHSTSIEIPSPEAGSYYPEVHIKYIFVFDYDPDVSLTSGDLMIIQDQHTTAFVNTIDFYIGSDPVPSQYNNNAATMGCNWMHSISGSRITNNTVHAELIGEDGISHADGYTTPVFTTMKHTLVFTGITTTIDLDSAHDFVGGIILIQETVSFGDTDDLTVYCTDTHYNRTHQVGEGVKIMGYGYFVTVDYGIPTKICPLLHIERIESGGNANYTTLTFEDEDALYAVRDVRFYNNKLSFKVGVDRHLVEKYIVNIEDIEANIILSNEYLLAGEDLNEVFELDVTSLIEQGYVVKINPIAHSDGRTFRPGSIREYYFPKIQHEGNSVSNCYKIKTNFVPDANLTQIGTTSPGLTSTECIDLCKTTTACQYVRWAEGDYSNFSAQRNCNMYSSIGPIVDDNNYSVADILCQKTPAVEFTDLDPYPGLIGGVITINHFKNSITTNSTTLSIFLSTDLKKYDFLQSLITESYRDADLYSTLLREEIITLPISTGYIDTFTVNVPFGTPLEMNSFMTTFINTNMGKSAVETTTRFNDYQNIVGSVDRILFKDTNGLANVVSGCVTVGIDTQGYGNIEYFDVYVGETEHAKTRLVYSIPANMEKHYTVHCMNFDIDVTNMNYITVIPQMKNTHFAYYGTSEPLIDNVFVDPANPVSMEFTDTEPDDGEISGILTINPAPSLTNCDEYIIYMGTTINKDAIEYDVIAASNSPVSITILDSLGVGVNTHFYAACYFKGVIQNYNFTELLIHDMHAGNTEPIITFTDTDVRKGYISGVITIDVALPTDHDVYEVIMNKEPLYYLSNILCRLEPITLAQYTCNLQPSIYLHDMDDFNYISVQIYRQDSRYNLVSVPIVDIYTSLNKGPLFDFTDTNSIEGILQGDITVYPPIDQTNVNEFIITLSYDNGTFVETNVSIAPFSNPSILNTIPIELVVEKNRSVRIGMKPVASNGDVGAFHHVHVTDIYLPKHDSVGIDINVHSVDRTREILGAYLQFTFSGALHNLSNTLVLLQTNDLSLIFPGQSLSSFVNSSTVHFLRDISIHMNQHFDMIDGTAFGLDTSITISSISDSFPATSANQLNVAIDIDYSKGKYLVLISSNNVGTSAYYNYIDINKHTLTYNIEFEQIVDISPTQLSISGTLKIKNNQNVNLINPIVSVSVFAELTSTDYVNEVAVIPYHFSDVLQILSDINVAAENSFINLRTNHLYPTVPQLFSVPVTDIYLNPPVEVSFVGDIVADTVSGDIYILRAPDETNIDEYVVYIGISPQDPTTVISTVELSAVDPSIAYIPTAINITGRTDSENWIIACSYSSANTVFSSTCAVKELVENVTAQFDDHDDHENYFSGAIIIKTPKINVSSINIYLSTSTETADQFVTSVPVTSMNIEYIYTGYIPEHTDITSYSFFITQVYEINGSIHAAASPIVDLIVPSDVKVPDIHFTDTDKVFNYISGTITITYREDIITDKTICGNADFSTIYGEALYVANTLTYTLEIQHGTLLNNETFIYCLSHASGVNYFKMGYTRIIDSAHNSVPKTAVEILFHDTKPESGQISGVISIRQPVNFQSIYQYNVYISYDESYYEDAHATEILSFSQENFKEIKVASIKVEDATDWIYYTIHGTLLTTIYTDMLIKSEDINGVESDSLSLQLNDENGYSQNIDFHDIDGDVNQIGGLITIRDIDNSMGFQSIKIYLGTLLLPTSNLIGMIRATQIDSLDSHAYYLNANTSSASFELIAVEFLSSSNVQLELRIKPFRDSILPVSLPLYGFFTDFNSAVNIVSGTVHIILDILAMATEGVNGIRIYYKSGESQLTYLGKANIFFNSNFSLTVYDFPLIPAIDHYIYAYTINSHGQNHTPLIFQITDISVPIHGPSSVVFNDIDSTPCSVSGMITIKPDPLSLATTYHAYYESADGKIGTLIDSKGILDPHINISLHALTPGTSVVRIYSENSHGISSDYSILKLVDNPISSATAPTSVEFIDTDSNLNFIAGTITVTLPTAACILSSNIYLSKTITGLGEVADLYLLSSEPVSGSQLTYTLNSINLSSYKYILVGTESGSITSASYTFVEIIDLFTNPVKLPPMQHSNTGLDDAHMLLYEAINLHESAASYTFNTYDIDNNNELDSTELSNLVNNVLTAFSSDYATVLLNILSSCNDTFPYNTNSVPEPVSMQKFLGQFHGFGNARFYMDLRKAIGEKYTTSDVFFNKYARDNKIANAAMTTALKEFQLTTADINIFISSTDWNNDNSIQYDEFSLTLIYGTPYDIVRKLIIQHNHPIINAFEALDADKSNSLNSNEILYLPLTINGEMSFEEFRDSVGLNMNQFKLNVYNCGLKYTDFDINGNSTITKASFKYLLQYCAISFTDAELAAQYIFSDQPYLSIPDFIMNIEYTQLEHQNTVNARESIYSTYGIFENLFNRLESNNNLNDNLLLQSDLNKFFKYLINFQDYNPEDFSAIFFTSDSDITLLEFVVKFGFSNYEFMRANEYLNILNPASIYAELTLYNSFASPMTVSDVVNLIKQFYLSTTEATIIVNFYDLNSDSNIDETEFMTNFLDIFDIFNKEIIFLFNPVDSFFALYDTDVNGELSESELSPAFAAELQHYENYNALSLGAAADLVATTNITNAYVLDTIILNKTLLRSLLQVHILDKYCAHTYAEVLSRLDIIDKNGMLENEEFYFLCKSSKLSSDASQLLYSRGDSDNSNTLSLSEIHAIFSEPPTISFCRINDNNFNEIVVRMSSSFDMVSTNVQSSDNSSITGNTDSSSSVASDCSCFDSSTINAFGSDIECFRKERDIIIQLARTSKLLIGSNISLKKELFHDAAVSETSYMSLNPDILSSTVDGNSTDENDMLISVIHPSVITPCTGVTYVYVHKNKVLPIDYFTSIMCTGPDYLQSYIICEKIISKMKAIDTSTDGTGNSGGAYSLSPNDLLDILKDITGYDDPMNYDLTYKVPFIINISSYRNSAAATSFVMEVKTSSKATFSPLLLNYNTYIEPNIDNYIYMYLPTKDEDFNTLQSCIPLNTSNLSVTVSSTDVTGLVAEYPRDYILTHIETFDTLNESIKFKPQSDNKIIRVPKSSFQYSKVYALKLEFSLGTEFSQFHPTTYTIILETAPFPQVDNKSSTTSSISLMNCPLSYKIQYGLVSQVPQCSRSMAILPHDDTSVSFDFSTHYCFSFASSTSRNKYMQKIINFASFDDIQNFVNDLKYAANKVFTCTGIDYLLATGLTTEQDDAVTTTIAGTKNGGAYILFSASSLSLDSQTIPLYFLTDTQVSLAQEFSVRVTLQNKIYTPSNNNMFYLVLDLSSGCISDAALNNVYVLIRLENISGYDEDIQLSMITVKTISTASINQKIIIEANTLRPNSEYRIKYQMAVYPEIVAAAPIITVSNRIKTDFIPQHPAAKVILNYDEVKAITSYNYILLSTFLYNDNVIYKKDEKSVIGLKTMADQDLHDVKSDRNYYYTYVWSSDTVITPESTVLLITNASLFPTDEIFLGGNDGTYYIFTLVHSPHNSVCKLACDSEATSLYGHICVDVQNGNSNEIISKGIIFCNKTELTIMNGTSNISADTVLSTVLDNDQYIMKTYSTTLFILHMIGHSPILKNSSGETKLDFSLLKKSLSAINKLIGDSFGYIEMGKYSMIKQLLCTLTKKVLLQEFDASTSQGILAEINTVSENSNSVQICDYNNYFRYVDRTFNNNIVKLSQRAAYGVDRAVAYKNLLKADLLSAISLIPQASMSENYIKQETETFANYLYSSPDSENIGVGPIVIEKVNFDTVSQVYNVLNGIDSFIVSANSRSNRMYRALKKSSSVVHSHAIEDQLPECEELENYYLGESWNENIVWLFSSTVDLNQQCENSFGDISSSEESETDTVSKQDHYYVDLDTLLVLYIIRCSTPYIVQFDENSHSQNVINFQMKYSDNFILNTEKKLESTLCLAWNFETLNWDDTLCTVVQRSGYTIECDCHALSFYTVGYKNIQQDICNPHALSTEFTNLMAPVIVLALLLILFGIFLYLLYILDRADWVYPGYRPFDFFAQAYSNGANKNNSNSTHA